MATTRWIALPELAEGQDDKELIYNEAMWRIDIMLNRAVIAILNTPAVGAIDGDAYIVGPAPTGAWATHANDIAFWINGGWAYIEPSVDSGWIFYVSAVSPPTYYRFEGTGSPSEWQPTNIA